MYDSIFQGEGSESEKHDDDFDDKVSLLVLRRDLLFIFCTVG